MDYTVFGETCWLRTVDDKVVVYTHRVGSEGKESVSLTDNATSNKIILVFENGLLKDVLVEAFFIGVNLDVLVTDDDEINNVLDMFSEILQVVDKLKCTSYRIKRYKYKRG